MLVSPGKEKEKEVWVRKGYISYFSLPLSEWEKKDEKSVQSYACLKEKHNVGNLTDNASGESGFSQTKNPKKVESSDDKCVPAEGASCW